MRFFQILLLLLPGACLMGQTPPPGSKPVVTDGATFPIEVVKPAGETIDPKKVVLQVGEARITAEQLDNLIDVYPPNMQVFARGPGRQQFAENVVRMLVLAEEGRKLKLNQTDKFIQQMQFSEANLLSQLANDALKNSVKPSDAALRKYYDDHHCEYEQWHPRQLVVRAAGSPLPLRAGEKDLSEAEALAKANALRARLEGGADFAELARTESDDVNSGANGGDMGTVSHGAIMPSLEATACSLKVGALSEPLKTPFGYHLIKLESRDGKTFKEMRAEIEPKVAAELAKKAVDDLIAKVKVVKDPEYYSPPVATPIGEPKKQ